MASRFANLPDYILGVTFEIWEGRQLHRCTMHTGAAWWPDPPSASW